jgi:hypothetical protein
LGALRLEPPKSLLKTFWDLVRIDS